jgi:hypothetical protein
MKVVFVHGALVFDGAWWWERMVEPLAALGMTTRAVELPSCVPAPGASGEAGRHVRRRGPRRARRGGRTREGVMFPYLHAL